MKPKQAALVALAIVGAGLLAGVIVLPLRTFAVAYVGTGLAFGLFALRPSGESAWPSWSWAVSLLIVAVTWPLPVPEFIAESVQWTPPPRLDR